LFDIFICFILTQSVSLIITKRVLLTMKMSRNDSKNILANTPFVVGLNNLRKMMNEVFMKFYKLANNENSHSLNNFIQTNSIMILFMSTSILIDMSYV